MALPEIVKRKVESVLSTYCDDKIPGHVKDKIRLEFSFRGNNVTLVERRPHFLDPKAEWTSSKVAQFRFNPDKVKWKLFCSDRNGKWHAYLGPGRYNNLERLIGEVEDDPTGIFWG